MENLQDKFEQVQNAEYSALKLSLEIREVEAQLKKLKEMVNVYVINELDNNGEPINEGNFTFTKSTARTFFDYSGNEDWTRLQTQIDKLKREQRPIEKEMVSVYKSGRISINEDTGEVFQPAKYKSGGGDTFRVTQNKK